jgi:hypothetical protein
MLVLGAVAAAHTESPTPSSGVTADRAARLRVPTAGVMLPLLAEGHVSLRLKGGRTLSRNEKEDLEAPGEGASMAKGRRRQPGSERPLPVVGEAMKAKILKNRQMRKGKVPEDPEQARKKLERKKQHDMRREEKDRQRAASKQLKMKDRKSRPFMRERKGQLEGSSGPGRRRGDSTDARDGAANREGNAEAAAPALAPGRAAAGGHSLSGGLSEVRISPARKLSIAMPARDSILRPFWDPQGKGRDIGSPSPEQRRRARARLLHALVGTQRELAASSRKDEQGSSAPQPHAHAEVRYALQRLVRGLASADAGTGFAEALVAVLKVCVCVMCHQCQVYAAV